MLIALCLTSASGIAAAALMGMLSCCFHRCSLKKGFLWSYPQKQQQHPCQTTTPLLGWLIPRPKHLTSPFLWKVHPRILSLGPKPNYQSWFNCCKGKTQMHAKLHTCFLNTTCPHINPLSPCSGRLVCCKIVLKKQLPLPKVLSSEMKGNPSSVIFWRTASIVKLECIYLNKIRLRHGWPEVLVGHFAFRNQHQKCFPMIYNMTMLGELQFGRPLADPHFDTSHWAQKSKSGKINSKSEISIKCFPTIYNMTIFGKSRFLGHFYAFFLKMG